MVVLGLGSNLEDRLDRLRQALFRIKQIPGLKALQVSPLYTSDALLPSDAPRNWARPYLNAAVSCETTLKPYELLHQIKQIEKDLGRTFNKDWGPRVIDIDILAWDDWVQYDETLHVPHEHLSTRPFALWPLADIAPLWVFPAKGPLHGKTAVEMASVWPSRFDGSAPLKTRQLPHRIDMPQLIGIINITPDSFSGDGLFLKPAEALQQIERLIDEGAEIIDIGAEATGPSAHALGPDEELKRLTPVLELALAKRSVGAVPIKISVDTYHPETAAFALKAGADWINDVTGLDNPRMLEVLAPYQCNIVFMHHLGIPVKQHTLPLHQSPVDLISQWLEEKLRLFEKHQIALSRLIFDPGIGFGKTAEQSLTLLQQIEQFKSFGIKLMVGHSRKSFIKQFSSRPAAERDLETVTLSLSLAQKSVDYLRVHNIAWHMRSFKMTAMVSQASL